MADLRGLGHNNLPLLLASTPSRTSLNLVADTHLRTGGCPLMLPDLYEFQLS